MDEVQLPSVVILSILILEIIYAFAEKKYPDYFGKSPRARRIQATITGVVGLIIIIIFVLMKYVWLY